MWNGAWARGLHRSPHRASAAVAFWRALAKSPFAKSPSKISSAAFSAISSGEAARAGLAGKTRRSAQSASAKARIVGKRTSAHYQSSKCCRR